MSCVRQICPFQQNRNYNSSINLYDEYSYAYNLSTIAVMITSGKKKRLSYLLEHVEWYGADIYIAKSHNYCREPSLNENVSSFIKWQTSKEWYLSKIDNKGWWCANRKFFSNLKHFFIKFPNKSYYLFMDDDSVINTQNLYHLVQHAQKSNPYTFYIGHMIRSMYTQTNFQNFIGSGGGVFLKGDHLRKLVFTGKLEQTRLEQENGKYSWWPLDWVLAETLAEIQVYAQSHRSFQQFSGESFSHCSNSCHPNSIICHPYKTIQEQKKVYESWKKLKKIEVNEDNVFSTCSINRVNHDFAISACYEDYQCVDQVKEIKTFNWGNDLKWNYLKENDCVWACVYNQKYAKICQAYKYLASEKICTLYENI